MVVGEVHIETDVVVVGGGPGGYVAAIRAAELGLATVLIEREERPGGLCLHHGCMPSKALLAAADLAQRARLGASMGVVAGEITVDVAALRSWQRGIVDRLARGVATLLEKHGVTVVRGEGVLAGANRVAVAASHGAERYNARRGVVVAAGAAPCAQGGLTPDGVRVLRAADALFLERLPASAAVVGGDYIAVELAVALRKLGSAVTLLGAGTALLPELGAPLTPLAVRGLRRLGIAWRPDDGPLELTEHGLRLRSDAGGEDEIAAEVVILSSGGARQPNVAELGLELLGARQDAGGLILVDERQRSSLDGLYAVGDVTPGPAWAHRAYRQGKVAAEAIAGRPAAYDPRALPAVALAEPELASVGLDEKAAHALGYDAVTTRFTWAASGRALTLGAADGQTITVSERGSGVLLGVHIAGASAGELIGEAALALEMGATLEDLAATIHPHPTLSEGLVEASELALGLPTHLLS